MESFPQFDPATPTTSENVENHLFGLSLQQLEKFIERNRLEQYRSRQIWHALYQQRVSSLQEITSLPQSVREGLVHSGYSVGLPQIAQTFVSDDGTERYLIACADGETVETVWMPNGDDGEMGDGSEAANEEESAGCKPRPSTTEAQIPAAQEPIPYRRATICVSSQVGCAVNCQFCLTAKLGMRRNLTAGEIAGQVAAVLNRHQVRIGRDRINLVFMGMGEPFLNYDHFMAAVHLLVEGMGIPESRMTVSTSGILPGIERFATEALRPKLALSLNASNDTIRESMMPITRKWKIEDLLRAMCSIPLRPRERLTFEYVLLGGVNDRMEDARELVALLRRAKLAAKVNLIVWNPGPDIPYRMPSPDDVAAFQKCLIDGGIPAFLRRPRGRDIYAACGQLKRTLE
ncbi:MAG: 23S rRNA (adenine(2503)-C(2))-methyltransferase RlmN [Acidobacteriaceae bacterium]